MFLLDRNILSHPRHLYFFVSTQPEYSIATSTPPFLRIYSTKIFYCILDTSSSSYVLNQNVLSHPRHLYFFISTRPKYSIASSTPPLLCINSTRIFHRILDKLHFFVSTQPEYSIASLTPPFLRIYSTKIFVCIRDSSIFTYQVDQNILSHPRHLHFYVSTRNNMMHKCYLNDLKLLINVCEHKCKFCMRSSILPATQGVLFCQHQDDDEQTE